MIKDQEISLTNPVALPTKIVAVTSCPTGVAHTFMAAKALEKEAAKRGLSFKVQKNGSQGKVDELTQQDITEADLVIIAADIKVDMSPFAGKKVYKVSAKKALSNPAGVFDKAITAKTYLIQDDEAFFKGKWNMYRHILTGISFMLPFVIAGGILTAVSFFWGIYSADPTHPEQYNKFAASLKAIGAAGMGLMVPALAGYIGYSIGDRPALVPAFIGGFLAQNGFEGVKNTALNINYTSGFLGAIIAGLLAGYIIQLLRLLTKRVPQKFNAIKPMLIFPLFGTLIVGLLMIWALNTPVGWVQGKINDGLANIGGTASGSSIGAAIGLGVVLGVLTGTDFGGPFNKVAYLFGVADLATHGAVGEKSVIMAAVSSANIMPPLATGLGVILFSKKFSQEERSAGYTNILLGCTHITEGTIPFAAKRPIVNIPIFMLGAVISCVTALLFGCATAAPHGGLIVLPLVDKWYLWLLSIVLGTAVSGILLGLVTKNSLAPKKTNYFWYQLKQKNHHQKELKNLTSSEKEAKKLEFKQKLQQEVNELKVHYQLLSKESKIQIAETAFREKNENLEKKKNQKLFSLKQRQQKNSQFNYQEKLEKLDYQFNQAQTKNQTKYDQQLAKINR